MPHGGALAGDGRDWVARSGRSSPTPKSAPAMRCSASSARPRFGCSAPRSPLSWACCRWACHARNGAPPATPPGSPRGFRSPAGGGAVGALTRGAGGVSHASGWLVNLVSRGPGLEPDAPPSAARSGRAGGEATQPERVAGPAEAGFAPNRRSSAPPPWSAGPSRRAAPPASRSSKTCRCRKPAGSSRRWTC